MRPLLGASVAVFREGRVLLIQREWIGGAHVWSVPGGKVELGETLEAAALRELREEVAVDAALIGFAGHAQVIHPAPGGGIAHHFVVVCFAARWLKGEPQVGPEALAVRWIKPDQLDTLETTPDLPSIVRSAQSLLEQAR
jgi:ADP-ribose pyrophosphatase YjhB (NUDIX family)